MGERKVKIFEAAPFLWLRRFKFHGLAPVSGFWVNFVEGFAVLCLRRFYVSSFNGFAVSSFWFLCLRRLWLRRF